LLFRKNHTQPIENWNPIGMRGTASEGYRVTDLFVPEAFSGTREDPSLRRDRGPLYAFTMQGLYAVGVAGVAFGIARAMLDAFIALAGEKAPRGLQRLADSSVVQADVARQEAALGSARAWLAEILREVWAGADDIEPIGLEARMRVRLGCAQAITTAISVADYVYKAAGTSAIFPGTPFERRFRDMHTLSQQIQSRDSHFEAVGKAMFNGDPEGLFL
jgi:alkylation response protein AidB-like acyl-CoA dehydrogenase